MSSRCPVQALVGSAGKGDSLLLPHCSPSRETHTKLLLACALGTQDDNRSLSSSPP